MKVVWQNSAYVLLAVSSFVLCMLLMIGLVLMTMGTDHVFLSISCGLIGAAVRTTKYFPE